MAEVVSVLPDFVMAVPERESRLFLIPRTLIRRELSARANSLTPK